MTRTLTIFTSYFSAYPNPHQRWDLEHLASDYCH